MEKISANLIAASDVHLREMQDDRGRLLLEAIELVDRDACEFFILNGDIFDFCLGSTDFYRQKFLQLGKALTALAEDGVQVIFIEGNHEFHIRDIGWPGVHFVDGPAMSISLRNGLRIKVGHGDLIRRDPGYRIYRGLVKSPLALAVARLIPQQVFDRLCLRYAGHSRSLDESRQLDFGQLFLDLKGWLADDRHSLGIVGHFHVPFADYCKPGGPRLLSVDCWDKPNLLAVNDDGQVDRVWLQRDRFSRELAVPILQSES